MNDTTLDRLLAEQARVRDEDVAGWDLGEAQVALRERIVGERVGARAAVPAVPAVPVAGPVAVPVRGWTRRPARLLVAAAAVAVLAAGLVVASPFGGGLPEGAYAAEVVAKAERSPRLLLVARGWEVTYVDERTAVDGEMTFEHGDEQATVHWYPASRLADYVDDRRKNGYREDEVRMFGRTAVRFRGPDGTSVLGLLDGERMFELRGPDGVVDDLRVVDPQRWLDALPDSAFSGGRRSLAIDGMLTGLPLPPGYDPAPLKDLGIVSDRYQLGAAVVQSVGCVWFDRWFDAREAGDAAGAAEVSRVLRGSREWPVLGQMNDAGDYPEVFWDTADATVTGVPAGGKEVPISREVVGEALGCEP